MTKFTVVLAPEARGGFSAICPALPGCISEGDSRTDALANIREAIILCLEVRKREGHPSPVETRRLSPKRFEPASKTAPQTVCHLRLKPRSWT